MKGEEEAAVTSTTTTAAAATAVRPGNPTALGLIIEWITIKRPGSGYQF